jgi:fatty acid desaturase
VKRWTESPEAYAWSAVLRNALPFFFLLAVAPLLGGVSPVAPWLLAPLIGLMVYRMTVVMHDCIHRSLFKHAAVNLRVGQWLGALTGIDFHRFAIQHLRHHRTYGTPQDPQGFQYAGLQGMGRGRFAWHLLKPLLGLNLRHAAKESFVNPANLRAAARSGNLLRLAVMQGLVFATVTAAGNCWSLAPLPFISAVTFGLFFSQLRGIAEHGAAAELGNVRSHAAHWLDRALLYDLNFNYHAEHHRLPGLASRHLPAAHRARHGSAAPSMLRTIASIRCA